MSISLTPEQVERIRSHSLGWENDWARLCVMLLGYDGESGALVRAVKALPVNWPKGSDFEGGCPREGTERDDFIAAMMARYHHRAHKGTLLLRYDPELGDVIGFLTPRQMLYVEAVKFLRSLPHRKPRDERVVVSLDDVAEPDAKRRFKQRANSQTHSEFKKLIDTVQKELQRKLEETRRITRIIEQAGIQLYPRLDWSRPGISMLREHLSNLLSDSGHAGDQLKALERAHLAAEAEFEKKLDELAACKYNFGRGVAPRKRESLERRISKLRFQSLFVPISEQVLAELLGITAADAAQRRSRYGKSLPKLLLGVRAAYEALTKQR